MANFCPCILFTASKVIASYDRQPSERKNDVGARWLQFYLMHFMPYPDVVPGRPQGQWVDIPNTHFDPEKGHKLG
jgi:hypothetical protein